MTTNVDGLVTIYSNVKHKGVVRYPAGSNSRVALSFGKTALVTPEQASFLAGRGQAKTEEQLTETERAFFGVVEIIEEAAVEKQPKKRRGRKPKNDS